MSDRPIRLILIEDEQLLAQTLAAWIQRQPDLELVGSATEGEEGYRLYQQTIPDLVLTDIEVPNVDGLQLARRILEQEQPARVLAMSGMSDPYTIWRVRQSGIHGYVDKTQNAAVLMEAVRKVGRGGTYFSEVFEQVKKDWLAQPEAFHKILSEREQQVLQCVVNGCDDKSIAKRMGISVATVAVHRKHVRQKLELHNDRELVAYARRWGLSNVSELPCRNSQCQ